MPAIINSDDGVLSGSSGLKTSGANDGLLNLQTNGSTAMSVNASQQVTFNNTANLPNTFGFKNRIINGDMRIAQRGTGSITADTTNQFPVDRFKCNGSTSGKFTAQQNAGSVTPPAGFTNYLGATSSSAYSVPTGEAYSINHIIEGFNVADLGWGAAGAQSVTLSFWVRSSLTGTFGGAIRNSASNRAYPYTYTISAANTWEQKTVTIAGDTSGTWLTNNGEGILIIFSLGAGTSLLGTAGAWTGTSSIFGATGQTNVVATNGATFYITGVQLERGSTATSFDFRPYGTELMLCQRYYMGISGSASNTLYVFTAQAVANNYALGNFQPFVPMRATPVISYNLIAASNSTGSSSGATTVTIEAGSTGQSLRVGVTGGTGLTAGNASIIGLTSSSSFFNLSAEL